MCYIVLLLISINNVLVVFKGFFFGVFARTQGYIIYLKYQPCQIRHVRENIYTKNSSYWLIFSYLNVTDKLNILLINYFIFIIFYCLLSPT